MARHNTRSRRVVHAAAAAVMGGAAALASAQPCQVPIPPGAVFEPGGCTSDPTPCAAVAIACGVPMVGSVAFSGQGRDTDWYQFTLSEPRAVTITFNSEFAGMFGVVQTTVPVPTGDCAEFTGFINPAGFTQANCTGTSISADLGPGTWTILAAAQFVVVAECESGDTQYVLTVACDGAPADCNGNGVPDDEEIAAGARDCYDPHPMAGGGSDGILDACQCQADWNLDGAVTSSDISSFLTRWLSEITGATLRADVDCSGVVDSRDLSAFLALWLSAVQNLDPHNGCP